MVVVREDAGGWQNPPENADQQQPARITEEDIQRIAKVAARLVCQGNPLQDGQGLPVTPAQQCNSLAGM